MLKISGLIILAASGTFAGLAMSARLKNRCRELEAAIKMTDGIITMIRYRRMTVSEICNSLKASCEYKSLEFIEKLECEGEFSTAWQRALSASKSNMKMEDIEILAGIGNALGRSDADGEISMLTLAREKLFARLSDAREEARSKGRLYRSLGAVSGAGIAIVLM
ncbi:MAG: stage III sporulation protein AB [Oscillospiraceae bacterium]